MQDPLIDLGFARVDTHRAHRTGDPEVVFAQGKSPDQTVHIMQTLHRAHPDRAVLATRVDDGTSHALQARLPEVHLDPVGRTAVLGPLPQAVGQVLVVCAGTSDLPVAAEAATTARVFGTDVDTISDVGVAGLHRLLAVREHLEQADALVVVAGMEGALPSVVGGLTGVPLVAVPTSVGYGASFGGLAALLAMLNSCAPGVTVVNIDNGFGAAVHAARIAPERAVTPWWIDAGTGASGDMLLGALLALDPGGLAPAQQAVDEVLGRLGPERVQLEVETVRRAGIAATRAHVRCEQTAGHRTWRNIAPALAGFHHAETVFGSLAAAEAQVHGVPIDEIHFHEVGALDAIADIVAVTTLWERLQPSVVVVSPVCVGSGSVRTAHGELSVPVPAVVQLLRGAPTFAGNTAHEACTPTGAALLHFMATAWGYQPLMTVDGIGVGAGGRDLPERPNVLRVLAGQSADQPASERLVVVETTIDDLDPRAYPDVLARTKQAGALESWLTQVVMKQGRPAVVITALCEPPVADEVAGVLFRETSTLGVRYTSVDRQALRRDYVTVEVQGHPIRVKRGWLDGEPVTVQPEYREALAAAGATGRPVRHVLDEARRLAFEG